MAPRRVACRVWGFRVRLRSDPKEWGYISGLTKPRNGRCLMKRTGDKIPERTCRAGATRNAYQLPFPG
jgi:hypothetical protein